MPPFLIPSLEPMSNRVEVFMEPTALFAYMITLAALTLTPGPLVAVLAARSASSDRRGACAGEILVFLLVGTMQRALHSYSAALLWARGMSVTVTMSAIWIFVS